jgi:ribosome-interacting GTPase 1
MPTNLPPDYYAVEKRYQAATDPTEKAELLEEMMSKIPKHKGTDHLRADLRRKLSKLKSASGSKKGVSRQGSVYNIAKQGAGQVVVIGPPNVGKSALVAANTNATPEVSPAPFSTWGPTPGMMAIENIQVQLIDTPPLNPDHVEADMFNLMRKADLLLIIVDLQADPVQQLEDGIALLRAKRIIPDHLVDPEDEDTIQHYFLKPCLVLANKCDDEDGDENFEIFRKLLEGECPMVPISVTGERNIGTMKQIIYQKLNIIRVYSQAPGEEAKMHLPFVLPIGSTVEEFAAKVHQDFAKNMKSARVWGQSAAFEGQTVSREHVLEEGDIVELNM